MAKGCRDAISSGAAHALRYLWEILGSRRYLIAAMSRASSGLGRLYCDAEATLGSEELVDQY